MGRKDCCRGYVSMMGKEGDETSEQKAKLIAIHMATKLRPMKNLEIFRRGRMELHQP